MFVSCLRHKNITLDTMQKVRNEKSEKLVQCGKKFVELQIYWIASTDTN